GVTTDFAGQIGARQSDGVYLPYADFKATGSLNYRNGGFSGLIQGRYTGKGVHDVSAFAATPVFIEDNTVDDVLYVDLRASYEFDLRGVGMEVFGNITNLFDRDPPIAPAYTAFLGYGTQYNSAVHDVLGR